MIGRAKSRLLSLGIPIALLLAACGSTSDQGASATPSPSPTPRIAKPATATVKGASKTVLVNADGLTLYIFTPDTPTKSACSGACAGNLPPLMVASGQPFSTVTGKWTVLDRTDPVGRQVLFNGHPLYTFIQDKAPGDAKGEGVNNKWFVATPDTPQASPGT